MQNGVVAGFAPYYLLVVGAFVVFAVWMGLSRFGDIKLGKDDDEPKFKLLSWFAMLFAAGMGIGLVFWGAAEPLTYFVNPKPGVEGDAAELAQASMTQTYLHWGFHAWAIYAVVGLSLAYAIHRRGRPVSIRWALEPLLGDRVRGRVGDAIDIIAIVGTLFGVATSLGLGVQQISAGLVQLGVFPETSDLLLVGLILAITLIATMSVVSGVDKGIKWLSNINLGMAGLFDADEGIVSENVLFNMLSGLPLGGVLSVIAVLLVAIFFITSSDSGSLVVDMLASGGETDPPKWSRVMWAVLEGLVAIALLLAGGLSALRTASILTALPISVVIIGMCMALYKALSAEHQLLVRAERRQRREELAHEISDDVTDGLSENFDRHFGEQVDDRIEYALPDEVETKPRPWQPRGKSRQTK